MGRSSSGSLPLPWLRWRGLNLQLFLLIFLPVTVILLAITFGSLTLHQRAMRTLVGERDERAARTTAAAISEQLNHRGAAVRGLALRATDHNIPQEILLSSDFLDPDFDYGMAFFSPDGEFLASSVEAEFWLFPSDELEKLLFNARVEAGSNAVFSSALQIPTHDDLIVFVAAAANKNAPIAIGAFSPTTLARRTLAGAFAPGEQSAAFIVAPDKQLIYQIGGLSASESPENHPGVAEALRGESGTTYFEIDDSEHVITFSPILPTGWALVIEEPWESVANPLLNTTQLAPLVLVPVILLSLVALWFGAKQIVQPLQDLESRSSDLAWGNYKTIDEPVGGIDEIRRLQRTLIHLAVKIQRSQEGLRSYIGAITTGQEDERRRLARELHDDTIQALIALNQRVQLTQMKLTADPEATTALEEIQNLTEQTIQDLRRVVRALRPLYLEDLGLVASLKMLTHETTESAGIPIGFSHNGVEKRLSPKTELAIYRIAQEALSNIIRHAQASMATLEITYTSDGIMMTIIDNGHGFNVPENPAEFAPSGHYGLLGIHERAELIGARLEIISEIEKGTQLTITISSQE